MIEHGIHSAGLSPAQRFHSEVLEQPAALDRVMRAWPRSRGDLAPVVERARAGCPVLFAGMGASLAAVTIGETVLRTAGRWAVALDSAEILLYGASALPAGAVVFLASQTGLSRETNALAAVLRQRPDVTVVGVVNDPHSPLANAAYVIPMLAGPEETNATKTFTSTLLLTILFAREVAGTPVDASDMASLPEAVARVLADPTLVARPAAAFAECQYLAFLGHGPALSTARYAALISKEILARPGEAMSISEFRHGPIELAAGPMGAVVFAAGAARDLAISLACDIAQRTVPTWLLATDGADLPDDSDLLAVGRLPKLGEVWQPIELAIPIQRLLPVLAAAHGRAPGSFTAFDPIADTGRAMRTAG